MLGNQGLFGFPKYNLIGTNYNHVKFIYYIRVLKSYPGFIDLFTRETFRVFKKEI